MTDLTSYHPQWSPGLPLDGDSAIYLGESADSRRWLLRWAPLPDEPIWVGVGFITNFGERSCHPEIHAFRGDHRAFIVRHMPLPATMREEDPGRPVPHHGSGP